MDLTPASKLFIAIAVVLLVCRLLSALSVKFRQPVVVAEMVAGIALGPSLLGMLLPDTQHALMAPDIRPVFAVLGQLGVCLYMFLVGMDFSKTFNRRLLVNSALISVPGIALPLVLGFGAAMLVGLRDPVSAVFIGLVLAITALPVLARIIEDRGLEGTKVASTALAVGLVDDVLAWILLALLLAGGAQTGHRPLPTLVGLGVFVLVLVLVVRPLLGLLMARCPGRTPMALSVAAVLVCCAAATTEMLGLHLVIGAFAVGLAFPACWAGQAITDTIKQFSVTLLLPFYFVYTGLNVDLRVLTDPEGLGVTVLFLVVAMVAKLVAGSVATRLTGERWVDALRVGVLMNARGLMQLVALDIGLRSGLITQSTYSQLVVVAVVTTVVTGPLLSLINRAASRKERVSGPRTPSLSDVRRGL